MLHVKRFEQCLAWLEILPSKMSPALQPSLAVCELIWGMFFKSWECERQMFSNMWGKLVFIHHSWDAARSVTCHQWQSLMCGRCVTLHSLSSATMEGPVFQEG